MSTIELSCKHSKIKTLGQRLQLQVWSIIFLNMRDSSFQIIICIKELSLKNSITKISLDQMLHFQV